MFYIVISSVIVVIIIIIPILLLVVGMSCYIKGKKKGVSEITLANAANLPLVPLSTKDNDLSRILPITYDSFNVEATSRSDEARSTGVTTPVRDVTPSVRDVSLTHSSSGETTIITESELVNVIKSSTSRERMTRSDSNISMQSIKENIKLTSYNTTDSDTGNIRNEDTVSVDSDRTPLTSASPSARKAPRSTDRREDNLCIANLLYSKTKEDNEQTSEL